MEQASERKGLEQPGKGLRLCAGELEDASPSGHRGGKWSWPGSWRQLGLRQWSVCAPPGRAVATRVPSVFTIWEWGPVATVF